MSDNNLAANASEENILTEEKKKEILSNLDFEISKAKKEKEQKLVKEDPKEHRSDLENFRRMRNDAFKEYVKKCIKRQSWILGIYSFLCLLVVGACFCFWNCDMLIVIVAYMVLALAVMIILGIVISKCITATSSNLKADTDANRKLNEKIDEKVMGKMG